MIFPTNPSTPVHESISHDSHDSVAINLDALNFENSHRMSPLATNELPLSGTCLRVPDSDNNPSGSSLPDEHLLIVKEFGGGSGGERIRRNSCSLDYGQSSANNLNYSHRIDGNTIKVL